MGVPRHARTRPRRTLLAILAAVNIALIIGILIGNHGLRQYLRLRATLKQRSGEAYERIVRNQALREQLTSIRTDQRAVEEIARSTLGVAGTDEIVYVFRNPGDRTP